MEGRWVGHAHAGAAGGGAGVGAEAGTGAGGDGAAHRLGLEGTNLICWVQMDLAQALWALGRALQAQAR